MPVDKFGRINEVKMSGDGISLAYISNNFLRKDGTTSVTGSINMNGNTLTRVSNPVNPQDVATKSYVDGNSRLLDENGGYHMTGYLNMGFNKIRNIPEPEELNEAANKFYVDNGGAIVKNQDNSFTAVANINMQGYTLTDVIEPAEPQDVATKNYVDVNRAFIYGSGGYIASADISMGGRRITNAGTPMENQQVANKFYVDTVVEVATAGDKALTKNQDGSFSIDGNINMRGNSITGLPNPIDRDAAANKNYVDNGGAIVKNPDGSFTAAVDVSMGNHRINELGTPLKNHQAANKFYVDNVVAGNVGRLFDTADIRDDVLARGNIDMRGNRITNLPEPFYPHEPVTWDLIKLKLLNPQRKLNKHIISVHAEQQGKLLEGNYEFSFGNGSSGRSHGLGGYCMSAPGRIIRGSLMVLRGNKHLDEEIKINLVVNGEEKTDYSLIKETGKGCSCVVFPQPLEIKECDVINFVTKTNNTDVKNAYLTILIELDL